MKNVQEKRNRNTKEEHMYECCNSIGKNEANEKQHILQAIWANGECVVSVPVSHMFASFYYTLRVF